MGKLRIVVGENGKLDVIGLPKVYSNQYARIKHRELAEMGIKTVVVKDKALSNLSILYKC